MRLSKTQIDELATFIADEVFTRDELDDFLKLKFKHALSYYTGEKGLYRQGQEVLEWFDREDEIEQFCRELLLVAKPSIKAKLQALLARQVAPGLPPVAGVARWEPQINPLDYLYLFNRSDENDIVLEALRKFPESEEVLPIVVPILAERDDEYCYLIDRLNGTTIKDLSSICPPARWTSGGPPRRARSSRF
jgi:hypothetical protein